MDVIKIAAIGLIAATLAITIKKTNPEIALQISIVAGILIFLMIINYLTQAIDYVKELASKYPEGLEAITTVLKVIGIAYICEFAVQIIKDAGEEAIATKVELAGKLVIMILTLPMLGNFLELVMGLLS